MIISNIYIYSRVNVCIYKYVIRPSQTKISGYAPASAYYALLLPGIAHHPILQNKEWKNSGS